MKTSVAWMQAVRPKSGVSRIPLHPGYELQVVSAKYRIYSTMRSW